MIVMYKYNLITYRSGTKRPVEPLKLDLEAYFLRLALHLAPSALLRSA